MSYSITQVDPDHRSSWFSPQQCKDYYKVPYQFREIQIHWWDNPSQKPSHDGVVAYIKKKTGGSVNYVVSAGKITRMVTEENCALTTQNGNPYGIKLECSPYGTDEDYRTIGWLVADIQRRRGRLPLVPHKKYWNTTCPGTLNLARIQAEADKFNKEDISMLEKFNEGDRKNINEYFYGEDRGRFKNVVGKPWKEAMYGVFESVEFRIDQLVNKGDMPFVSQTYSDGDKFIGKPWKDLSYKGQKAGFVAVGQLFVKQ